MKTICILTATRAEYSLLKPIIIGLNRFNDITVKVVVTGAHLSKDFGLSYKQIEADGIVIDAKIPILSKDYTSVSVSKYMGRALIRFAEYFSINKPDMLIVLGDRYETMAVCCAAYNSKIPIAHIHGGETTEGALDEAYRHAISKMSQLHFTSTYEYKRRVIQLGENPNSVYNVGALGVENVLNVQLLEKAELEKELSFKLDIPFGIVTYHPVTLDSNMANNHIDQILMALSEFGDMRFIFTKANADAEGVIINKAIKEYVQKNKNATLFDSLGIVNYFSAIKYAQFVIGNSSSGIIEVPSFRKPTINIGDRQKGRVQGNSIINCKPESQDISKAIKRALSGEITSFDNPYRGNNTSANIISVIKSFLEKPIILKKAFYNISWED